MNTELMGAVLLATACILFCCGWIRQGRSDIRLAEAFATALERMAGIIRWQNLPIERVLQAESGHGPSGTYFSDVARYMGCGLALQRSWEKVFRDISNEEIKDCLWSST